MSEKEREFVRVKRVVSECCWMILSYEEGWEAYLYIFSIFSMEAQFQSFKIITSSPSHTALPKQEITYIELRLSVGEDAHDGFDRVRVGELSSMHRSLISESWRDLNSSVSCILELDTMD